VGNVKKKVVKPLNAVKKLNTGWNDRRPVREIDITSIKPSASLSAINKIISEKVIDYNVKTAYTGSIYLEFTEPKADRNFEIRISNHSKIDDLDSEIIEEEDYATLINIYSKERKDIVIDFLKAKFDKLPKLTLNKNVFVDKTEKKVLKSKHDEIVLKFFKKIKIDATKTDKQIQQQVLDYLVKKGTPATLKKREYVKSRGSWKLDKEYEVKGNITNIATTGKQITINGETGKDFSFDNKKDVYLHNIATNPSKNWKFYIENYNKPKQQLGMPKKKQKLITFSVYGNVKLANKCKKAGLNIIEIKELVPTYGKHKAYKIVDKQVTCSVELYNSFLENEIPKKDIYPKIIDEFKKIYPNIDNSTIDNIINQYISKNNRVLSMNIAKRAEALVVAYVRHNYTDYDSYTTKNKQQRDQLRTSANNEARKFINENFK